MSSKVCKAKYSGKEKGTAYPACFGKLNVVDSKCHLCDFLTRCVVPSKLNKKF